MTTTSPSEASEAGGFPLHPSSPERSAHGHTADLTLFDDVMVDIETMSLHPHNALILSIGLVEFNPRGAELKIGERMLITPDVYEQLSLCRHVDRDTQKFWKGQPGEASKHWLRAAKRWSVRETAQAVQLFLSNATRVWANGIQFDLSNIAALCDQADIATPWHYRAPRDMRTFCEETPVIKHGEFGTIEDFIEANCIVPHEPVSDCVLQAYKVWSHWPGGHST